MRSDCAVVWKEKSQMTRKTGDGEIEDKQNRGRRSRRNRGGEQWSLCGGKYLSRSQCRCAGTKGQYSLTSVGSK